MRKVVRFSRIIAQDAIISETTMPAPCSFARRRNGKSVTPDIGATITGVSILTPPPRSIGASGKPAADERELHIILARYSEARPDAILHLQSCNRCCAR